jgi:hypothetical protein
MSININANACLTQKKPQLKPFSPQRIKLQSQQKGGSPKTLPKKLKTLTSKRSYVVPNFR